MRHVHDRVSEGERHTFIATPRTLGQQLRLALYLWYARPAFSKGLSMRPPPATMPMNQLRSMFSEKMKAIMMQVQIAHACSLL